jgi:hypothetical protein
MKATDLAETGMNGSSVRNSPMQPGYVAFLKCGQPLAVASHIAELRYIEGCVSPLLDCIGGCAAGSSEDPLVLET